MAIFYKKVSKLSEFFWSVLIVGILVLIASVFFVSALNNAKTLKGNESFRDITYLFC
jgi:hypothetical protein